MPLDGPQTKLSALRFRLQFYVLLCLTSLGVLLCHRQQRLEQHDLPKVNPAGGLPARIIEVTLAAVQRGRRRREGGQRSCSHPRVVCLTELGFELQARLPLDKPRKYLIARGF